MLPILLESEELIVINKPPGLAVHRSKLVRNTSEFALQQLRDQIGQKVFPVHRLDRKTSGVLVFSKQQDKVAIWQERLSNSVKSYLAIVRGYTDADGIVNKPLLNDAGKLQSAETHYRNVGFAELAIPFGNHPTVRYSLVEVFPKTGRTHQIRKHFNHLRHPIIGDRPHGCNKQNKLFLERWNMSTMLLHAHRLDLKTEASELKLEAPIWPEFERMIHTLNFETDLVNL